MDPIAYHKKLGGKIEVISRAKVERPEDLSVAYTPGVAEPCLEIKNNPADAYKYTAKGNLVAVISNGTAVLGLGNIGALAGKPVMEGKGVLFKRFAGIDVFDLEVEELDPVKFVDIVASLEPTFGGINLEDIKAPECFQIEEELIKRMKIPVFHDDQHGTAVITAAGLLNALEIAKKKIEEVKIIFSGAGAASIACANLLIDLGVLRNHIFMFDSKGLLTVVRQDLNSYKKNFAQDKEETLSESLIGADVFIGVSVANILTGEMVKKMNSNPIVFAMANPIPEISYEEGKAAVPEIIMATGRSDYPNQINNVLVFPGIFRGALDSRVKNITDEMKLEASKAIAGLVGGKLKESYIIPGVFDKRVSRVVAKAISRIAK